jgi:hypothetical protein
VPQYRIRNLMLHQRLKRRSSRLSSLETGINTDCAEIPQTISGYRRHHSQT